MPEQVIREQVKQLKDSWRPIDRVYEEYAKSIGMSNTSFNVLWTILFNENCTQNEICKHTWVPKQTVNSVITDFYKNGLVVLEEQPEDRRTKKVKLTEKGKEYAQNAVCHIRHAEYVAMEQFTEAERELLINLFKRYADTCLETVLESINANKQGG
ncbi:MAG: winged helix-turn-helix transcriptional regulator [Oscillospiraceae bacterium]|nr:winged helix-turn-helix transcriptional regulator [Oscillospiraceae bacterium]